MQSVIILRINVNTAQSYVRSVSVLQFSEHFQLIIWQLKCQQWQQRKQEMANFFSAKFSAKSQFGIKSCFY